MTKKTVLVVDDSEILREIATQALKSHSFRVIEAEDAYVALSLLEMTTPDIFLIDIVMPGMDGIELCQRIRQRQGCSDKIIIMLTVKHEEDVREKAMAAGADFYMTKPFSPSNLLDVMNHLMHEQHRKRESAKSAHTAMSHTLIMSVVKFILTPFLLIALVGLIIKLFSK